MRFDGPGQRPSPARPRYRPPAGGVAETRPSLSSCPRAAGRPSHPPVGAHAMTDPDTILLETEEHMEKALEYLKNELRGVRTGRASPALVEYIKVDYYGAMTDLKALAAITIPEPTQLLIKPFDAGSVGAVKQAIEKASLGINPMVEGKQIRMVMPAMTQERRQKDAARVKKMGEEAKVAIRNVRRDGNKHAEGLSKSTTKHYPEDEIKTLKDEVQQLLEKYEKEVDKRVEEKTKELMTL